VEVGTLGVRFGGTKEGGAEGGTGGNSFYRRVVSNTANFAHSKLLVKTEEVRPPTTLANPHRAPHGEKTRPGEGAARETTERIKTSPGSCAVPSRRI
jgi:hypothetical protein